jgi:electron-transferring-flavoprotein dehydrogenase
MEFDVVIVGAGPAGLAAAIRIRQAAARDNRDVSVVVVEKGSEVGAHILSGVVVDPIGLDSLLPDWRNHPDCPLHTRVKEDRFLYLTQTGSHGLPAAMMPKLLDNHGNFIGSLGNVTRFLAARAEELGVEIFPDLPLRNCCLKTARSWAWPRATWVSTATAFRAPISCAAWNCAQPIHFLPKARAARSASRPLPTSTDEGSDFQKFGIGIKELWQIDPARFQEGLVQHSFGWPLDRSTGGGSFLYHFDENLVAVGFVVHLNYSNPTLSPFEEFQRFKTHPAIRDTFAGGKRIAYGARADRRRVAVGAPAYLPGRRAARLLGRFRQRAAHQGVAQRDPLGDPGRRCGGGRTGQRQAAQRTLAYEEGWRTSAIGQDLKPVRNVKPLWAKYGMPLGIMLGGADMWCNQLLGKSPFGTLAHGKPDSACLTPIAQVTPITYPKPDGVLTFDRLSSVFLSSTNHAEDQPCHLRLANPAVPIEMNLPVFGEPARLYCPAGVYEVVYDDEATKSSPRFVINSQNCVHCKTCDIKDPAQNITWVPPEGGGGPNYPNM